MQDNVPSERYSQFNQQEQYTQKYVHKVLPMPRRAIPQPWEDLASVLSRTASKMGYEHPKWLLSQTNIPHKIKPGALSVLHKCSDYLFLGGQLLLEEEQLYALTLHRFASRLYKLHSSTSPFPTYHHDRDSIDRPLLWYEDQHRFFLSETYTRICPLCLEEDDASERHDRLFWRYRHILICPKHHVFLVSRCPACQAHIPALRPNPLICPTCKKGEYRSGVLDLPMRDAWLLMSHQLLLHHLGVAFSEDGTRLEESGLSPLRHLASWEFFRLIKGFSNLFDISNGGVHPLLLNSLPLAEPVRLVAKHWGIDVERVASVLCTLYLLTSWPTHFLTFLSLLPRVLQEEYHYGAQSILVHNWNVQMVKGNYWCRGAYHSNTVSLMEPFFKTYGEYFHDLLKAEIAQSWQGGRFANEHVVITGDLKPVTADYTVAPHTWESLPSVLTRIARKMGYRRPEWVLRSTKEEPDPPSFPIDISLLEPGDASRWLGNRLRLNEEEMYHLTFHRFAAVLQGPPVSGEQRPEGEPSGLHRQFLLTHATVQRFCTPMGTTQICPACQDEGEGYELLYWRMRYVLFCPRHQLFLINRCPACHTLIPVFRRVNGTACAYCREGDYRAARRVPSFPNTLLSQGQELILHSLAIDALNGGEALPSLKASPLMQLEHWQIFSLLDRFGALVPLLLSSDILRAFTNHVDIQDELAYAHQTGNSRLAKQVILFAAVFATWPQSLHDLLERAVFTTQSWQDVDVALVEPIRDHQRSDGGAFSLFLQELGTLTTVAQRLSHKRREEAFYHFLAKTDRA
jgi:hypothetical protein